MNLRRRLTLLAALALLSFAAQAGHVLLEWNHDQDPNLAFEIWTSDQTLTNWHLLQLVTATNALLSCTNSAAFYRIRALDTQTGLTSDWATAIP